LELRLGAFENEVAGRRTLVSEGEEVTGGWRKLRYGELNDLCSVPNIKARKMRLARYVAHIREMRSAYNTSVGEL
jgi:hypothetical protein